MAFMANETDSGTPNCIKTKYNSLNENKHENYRLYKEK